MNISSFDQSRIEASVYIRNSQKRAIMLNTWSSISNEELITKILTKVSIPRKELIVFYEGVRIDNQYVHVFLPPKRIIHVIDARNVSIEKLTLHFKCIQETDKPITREGINQPTKNIQVASSRKIDELLEVQLREGFGIKEKDKYFLVYVGRKLSPSHTLEQQLVEDGSEIIIMKYKQATTSNRNSIESLREFPPISLNNTCYSHASSHNYGMAVNRKNSGKYVGCPPTSYIIHEDELDKKLEALNESNEENESDPPNVVADATIQQTAPGGNQLGNKILKKTKTLPKFIQHQSDKKILHIQSNVQPLKAGDTFYSANKEHDSQNFVTNMISQAEDLDEKFKKKKKQSKEEDSK